jgi:hypothetical protein
MNKISFHPVNTIILYNPDPDSRDCPLQQSDKMQRAATAD